MRPLVIYGTGGQGREVLAYLEDINDVRPTYQVLGWLDDDPSRRGERLKGLPILGPLEGASLRLPLNTQVSIAINDPAARYLISRRLFEVGLPAATIVHPTAYVNRHITLGEGTIVGIGAVVNTDTSIGRFNILNVGTTIAHDAQLGDFVSVSPRACISGNVKIEEGASVGTGVSTVQGTRIGAWSTVGAGAAIVRDVPTNATVVGVPARVIKIKHPGWYLGTRDESASLELAAEASETS